MLFMQHSSATDVGMHRSNNEDAYFSGPRYGLWIVADGMGGHDAGEVASRITVNSVAQSIKSGRGLSEAIEASHRDIIEAGKNGVGSPGMGSTVVAIKSLGCTYTVCWVGDSRAYLWNADDHQLTQMSTDHSYVQMLYESGAINAEERANHPEKNIITQCLGSIELDQVRVDSITGKWPKNSRILLCSDGLSDMLSDDQIIKILQQSDNLTQNTHDLIEAALRAGGKDNVTVQLLSAPSRPAQLVSIINHRLTLLTSSIMRLFSR